MVACRYGILLLVFNSTSHSFAALTRELLSQTLEEKFHIYALPCIILHLSGLSICALSLKCCLMNVDGLGSYRGVTFNLIVTARNDRLPSFVRHFLQSPCWCVCTNWFPRGNYTNKEECANNYANKPEFAKNFLFWLCRGSFICVLSSFGGEART